MPSASGISESEAESDSDAELEKSLELLLVSDFPPTAGFCGIGEIDVLTPESFSSSASLSEDLLVSDPAVLFFLLSFLPSPFLSLFLAALLSMRFLSMS